MMKKINTRLIGDEQQGSLGASLRMTLLRLFTASLGTQSWTQLMEFVKATKLISIIRRQREILVNLAVLQGWSGRN